MSMGTHNKLGIRDKMGVLASIRISSSATCVAGRLKWAILFEKKRDTYHARDNGH